MRLENVRNFREALPTHVHQRDKCVMSKTRSIKRSIDWLRLRNVARHIAAHISDILTI